MQYIKRDFEEKYINLIDKNNISVLLGPRRTGKSTFIEQYLKNKKLIEKVYFNFDELSTREDVLKYGLEKLIEIQSKKNNLDKIIFIDEAQKEPKVFDEIKLIYDKQKHNKKRYKFILTGSSSLNIQKNVSESLSGRVDIFKVYPFSILEALKLKNKEITSDFRFHEILNPTISFEKFLGAKKFFELPYGRNQVLKSTIKEIIEFGSLPEILELSDIERKYRYLRNYRDTYLEKDIKGSLNIGDLKGYSNLLIVLGSQIGNLVIKNELAVKTGLTTNTINKYLSILENTYILNFLNPYIFSASKRLIKSQKEYIFDNGVISLLNGFISYEQLILTGLIGSRFENLVLYELKKKLEPYFVHVDFYFWRSSSGNEIDLIIDFKEKIIPCEIKWADNPKQIKVKALKEFLKEYKKSLYGLVIYNGEFHIDKEDKIIYLPFANLALMN